MPNRRNRNKGSRSARTLGASKSDKMVRRRNARAQRKLGLPPDVQSGQRITRTIRWVNVSTSTAFPMTAQDLYDLFFIATSTTAGVRLYDGLKILNIRLYCPPPATGMSSVTLAFPPAGSGNGVGGPGETFCIPSSMSTPGKWSGPPPSGSLASMWLDPYGSLTLFSVGTMADGSLLGSMIDITLECVNSFTGAQTSVQSTIFGATAGLIYVRCLDTPALGTFYWQPAGGQNHV